MAPSNLTKSLRKWGALAVGFGGLVVVDATENSRLQALEPGAGASQQRNLRGDAVVLRLQGDTILISQRGGGFEQLALKDTQEAEYLRRLLRDAGAEEHSVSIPTGSIIVANGGAAGDGKKPKTPDTGTASGKKQPGKKGKQPPTTKSGDGK